MTKNDTIIGLLLLILGLGLTTPARSAEGKEAAKHESTQDKSTENKNLGDATSSSADELVKLSERLELQRNKLEQMRKDLEYKEGRLKMREALIEQRARRYEKVFADLKSKLRAQNQEQVKSLERLKSIYEKMNPKKAAKIFDGLELDVVVGLVSQMQEKKVALILDKMDGQKVQKITSKIMASRKLAGQ